MSELSLVRVPTMPTVNIHAAKTHLSRLVDEAASDQGTVIARAGKPVARLVPVTARSQGARRVLGIMANQMRIGDDFDAPLPDDMLDGLEAP